MQLAREAEAESANRHHPKTLEKVKIPAKTVVKFRVAKTAKDAVLGAKK